MMIFKLEKNTEFIELIKLLKVTNICSSGGEAKHLVDMGEVKLNGKVESRKRAKLRSGNRIEIFDKIIEIKK